ncbi:MAG: hypothetical protein GX632_07140 [Propioniciclava sp.]|nr:hypothetical protein [Propioniciclava sp.]
MAAYTWLLIFGVGLLIALAVLVVLVLVSTRRNTQLHPPSTPDRTPPAPPRPAVEPERDPWEEAMLANTPEPPPAPWLPPQQQAAPSTPSFGPGPEVLDRDALGRGRGAFDPTGWDDRPDGYEGTDFGMVGKE